MIQKCFYIYKPLKHIYIYIHIWTESSMAIENPSFTLTIIPLKPSLIGGSPLPWLMTSEYIHLMIVMVFVLSKAEVGEISIWITACSLLDEINMLFFSVYNTISGCSILMVCQLHQITSPCFLWLRAFCLLICLLA